MTRRRIGIAFTAAAALPLLAAFGSGGWWVHTVENLPEHLVVGEPVDLSISLRQHGISLMPIEVMEVRLTGPSTAAHVVKATPSSAIGYYTAKLLVSEPGEWKIELQSAHMRHALLPLSAVAAGGRPPAPLTVAERGRHLYVAKGCVTCHGSEAPPSNIAEAPLATIRLNVAPELVGRRFPSREYVERVMANPGSRAMPNLNLSPTEMKAIATFLHPRP